jgi:hypothetical protein
MSLHIFEVALNLRNFGWLPRDDEHDNYWALPARTPPSTRRVLAIPLQMVYSAGSSVEGWGLETLLIRTRRRDELLIVRSRCFCFLTLASAVMQLTEFFYF